MDTWREISKASRSQKLRFKTVLATWIIRSKTGPWRRRKFDNLCLPPKGGPSDKQRRVGVPSDVVTIRRMLKRRYAHLIEKLLVWVVFSPLSSASWMAAWIHSPQER